ncbi:MAG: DMT family transporter, partial [Burkholderiales bacterium]|nr:DMT family transporter [Burkholderiales bacterium]
WPNAQEWWAIAYNIVLVFGVCQLLWFRLASILPPVASSLSVMMIPVVGLFSGMIMLGERPTWADYAALAFVLFAMFTVLLPARSAAKP